DLWPDDFEVSLDEAKSFIAEEGTTLSDFVPSTIYFENQILADIVATILLPRKGSLSSLSGIDVFVLYCLLKKIKINWVDWLLSSMMECFQDTGGNNNLPYGMIISCILKVIGIDLSKNPAREISFTYENRVFTSIGYIFSKERWHKKAKFTLKFNAAINESPSGINSGVVQNVSQDSLLKDVVKIKASLGAVVDYLHKIQASLSQ
ncbi:hypothetical protein HAX54_012241, partial [Datura stramonium]|nr:hypothetical protein [Datura stramonium]